jgi:hypothetical protein
MFLHSMLMPQQSVDGSLSHMSLVQIVCIHFCIIHDDRHPKSLNWGLGSSDNLRIHNHSFGDLPTFIVLPPVEILHHKNKGLPATS